MLEEVMEAVDDLAKNLYRLFFSKISPFFHIGVEVAIIAVLQNKIVVIGGLLHIVQFNDIVALTAL